MQGLNYFFGFTPNAFQIRPAIPSKSDQYCSFWKKALRLNEVYGARRMAYKRSRRDGDNDDGGRRRQGTRHQNGPGGTFHHGTGTTLDMKVCRSRPSKAPLVEPWTLDGPFFGTLHPTITPEGAPSSLRSVEPTSVFLMCAITAPNTMIRGLPSDGTDRAFVPPNTSGRGK